MPPPALAEARAPAQVEGGGSSLLAAAALMDLDRIPRLPARNGESSTQELPQVAETAKRLAAANIPERNMVDEEATRSSQLERAGEPERP